MCYDSILFGNGLTVNLLNQLSPYIPEVYRFLLTFDGFMTSFIRGTLPNTMEKNIFFAFYRRNTKENCEYFAKMKEILAEYYNECDGNIEKHFGLAEFQKCRPFNYSAVKSLLPFFYNMWFCQLDKMLIETHQRKRIKRFYTSVKRLLTPSAVVYTTNFDLLADHILSPAHLHGKFVEDIRKYEECIWQREEKEFTFKYLWGWNGLGKGIAIFEKQHDAGATQLFDWDFFLVDQSIENLLIYGLSFQTSGYITNDFIEAMPQYQEPAIGAVIDEHILIRLIGLQNQHNNLKITFAYYNKNDLKHYQSLVGIYGLSNVAYIPSTSLHFVF